MKAGDRAKGLIPLELQRNSVIVCQGLKAIECGYMGVEEGFAQIIIALAQHSESMEKVARDALRANPFPCVVELQTKESKDD